MMITQDRISHLGDVLEAFVCELRMTHYREHAKGFK